MSLWKNAMIKARKEAATPPEGAMTMQQIAEDMGTSRERARKEVRKLIELGRVEVIPWKLVSTAGSLVNTPLYRLLPAGQTKALKKGKKP
jgi:hypothetical protein